MTGCELVQQMRQDERYSDIPILMVSVGGDDIRERAYNSGADLFLDKPVLHKQLISTIAKLLAWKNEQ
jgi:CheY-like chemotaxis protein